MRHHDFAMGKVWFRQVIYPGLALNAAWIVPCIRSV